MNENDRAPRADGGTNGEPTGTAATEQHQGRSRPGEARRRNESGAGSQADGATPMELEQELDELRSKAQSYLDLAQRTQADFVNYKRRIEQERSDFARSTRSEVIQKFLPALDDLRRAIQSLPPSAESSDWAQGIQIVERKFVQTLDSLGVKRIEAVGKPFDPWEEEAIAHQPSDTFPEGTVSNVIQPGYVIDGKVLRPAQVVVSSGRPANSA